MSRQPDAPQRAEPGSASPTYRDRVRGCLLGGAIGDALGAGIEFAGLAEIRAAHGPDGVTGYVDAYGRCGAVTDDTQMTLATVEGIIRASVRTDCGVCHPPSAVHRARTCGGTGRRRVGRNMPAVG